MTLALPNASGDVFVLNSDTLRAGNQAAAASPRLRMIMPLHRSQEALVQRMLNFLQPGTYIQPHLHALPSASETIHVLSGAIGFLIFDAVGNVKESYRLGADGLGFIDIEPNVWHGFVVLEPDTAIIEIKRGPFDGTGDKAFASWCPKENEPGTAEALKQWAGLFA